MNKRYIIIGVVMAIITIISISIVLIFTLGQGGKPKKECDHNLDKLCPNGTICGSDNRCRACTSNGECEMGKICSTNGTCIDGPTREQVIRDKKLVCKDIPIPRKEFGEEVTVIDTQNICFTDTNAQIPVASPHGFISGNKCYDSTILSFNQSIGADYDNIINNPAGAINQKNTVLYPPNDPSMAWAKVSGGACAVFDSLFFTINDQKVKTFSFYVNGDPIHEETHPTDNLSDLTRYYVSSNDNSIIIGYGSTYSSVSLEIVMSTDNGKTFNTVFSDTRKLKNSYPKPIAISGNGQYIIANSYTGTPLVNNNYGNHSDWKYPMGELSKEAHGAVGLSFTGQYQVAAYNNNIYLSSDYGYSFKHVQNIKEDIGIGIDCSICISYNGEYITFTPGPGKTYISSDRGVTWTENTTYSVHGMSINGDYMYSIVSVNSYSEIYASTDYGKTFNKKSKLPKLGYFLRCSPSGKYLCVSTGAYDQTGIYQSNDYGETFHFI